MRRWSRSTHTEICASVLLYGIKSRGGVGWDGTAPRLPGSITPLRSVSPSWSGNRPTTPDDARIFCPRTVKRRRSLSEARRGTGVTRWCAFQVLCADVKSGDFILSSPTRLYRSLCLRTILTPAIDRRSVSRVLSGENPVCFRFFITYSDSSSQMLRNV